MRIVGLALLAIAVSFLSLAAQPRTNAKEYVKKATRAATVQATLAAFGLPNLEGKWYILGPFAFSASRNSFENQLPAEKQVDLKATYTLDDGKETVSGWAEVPRFEFGTLQDLTRLIPKTRVNRVIYLYHEFNSPETFDLPLSLGGDDALAVVFNGEKVLSTSKPRTAAPDQDRVVLHVKAGVNKLLLKSGQFEGRWGLYVSPELPSNVGESARRQLDRDFPPAAVKKAAAAAADAEAAYYSITALPVPEETMLEVGGLAFRPDGKLFVCTRRGDIWLVHNPTATDPKEIKLTRFATGLHEPLGMSVIDNNSLYVVQRPELTKVTDRNGDGIADEYATVCDKWGVSGNYHEYAFGPARDRDGNFFIALNLGFSDGHQSRVPWRGWCVKVDSKTGAMEPWAYGLRSPNTIAFSPDGDLFYCDNQGEWCATNKLCHLKRGKFYGHQAGLRWVKDSPFAGQNPEELPSGMLYDGQKGPTANSPTGFPAAEQPAVWFPYGRMGNSSSEPVWDTTGGKFGPFAGHCFVGDQTKSCVMRVALEKVNGEYQGACFPFRGGFPCGVNRLAFAPDGSLIVGETNRGWGSIGGKPWGLHRVAYTGVLPFEIHHISLTKDGFDLTFTKPVDPQTLTKPAAVSVESFTYIYHKTYGSPEMDKRAEKVTAASLSTDGRTLSVHGVNPRKGRVFEFRLDGVKAADGSALVHPEAYYTVNELR